MHRERRESSPNGRRTGEPGLRPAIRRGLLGVAGLLLIGLGGGAPASAAPAAEGLDGYGYELVSPVSTAGQEVVVRAIGDDGNDVLFLSSGGFADVDGLPGTGTMYRARRTPDGWKTAALGGPPASLLLSPPGMGAEWEADWWRNDQPRTLWHGGPTRPDDSQDQQPFTGVKGGPWHAVAEPLPLSEVWATSTDLSGVLLRTRFTKPTLTDGTVDTRTGSAGVTGKYTLTASVRKADGTLDVRQVARQGGVTMSPTCDINVGGPNGGVSRGAVNRDGLSRIVFTIVGSGACGTAARRRVYAAEPFSSSPDAVDISASRCTLGALECGNAATVTFVGGATDASRVFMTTTQRLLDDDTQAGTDLYEYDFQRPEAERLRLVTPNPTPVNFLGVVAVSDSGTHVYFVARGDLADAVHGDAAPVEGSPNLYVRAADPDGGPSVTRFVGVLDESDSFLWNIPTLAPVTVTSDGRYLAFDSTARLTADKQPGDALSDTYRFDSATGDLRRLWTDDPDHNGANRVAGSTIGTSIGARELTGQGGNLEWGRSGSRKIASDGGSITFTSAEPLVPADVNGKDDVFVWTAETDSVSMISDGKDLRGSVAMGMSPDGAIYLFNTTEHLTHEHTATSVGLYAYRRGGGFPEPPAPPTPCHGDGCQTPGLSPPSPPLIGSVGLGGDGNVSARGRASVGISKLKAVTGSAARLKVRVPDAGRISVAGASVRRASRSASKAGIYSVRVVLSSRARKSLKKRKSLKVDVRISYKAKDGQSASKTVKVTFKQPKAKQNKATKGGR
jgi:hypothetical protein